jgi:hypothetical protein
LAEVVHASVVAAELPSPQEVVRGSDLPLVANAPV